VKDKASILHDEAMVKELRENPSSAAEYLRAALEDGEEPRVLLVALRRVAEARGGVAKVAKAAGVERESLYRALSAHGNPRLSTLVAVTKAMGLKLTVEQFAPPVQAGNIRLLVLDFDGVLTDNRVLVSEDGSESVYCSREDGWGIGKLTKAGVDAMILSTERNRVVGARARKLQIECVQDCPNKLKALQEIARQRGLSPKEIAYVGNDENDLECMRWVGLPIAVADANEAAKNIARWVVPRNGGQGAVRMVCDYLVLSLPPNRNAIGQIPGSP